MNQDSLLSGYFANSRPYEQKCFQQLGHVSIFLEDYPDAEPWPYLDKLICQWRKEEEAVRSSCGLPPADPYGRCSLFRDQEPTADWYDEAGAAKDEPTAGPIKPPTEPTPEPTLEPTAPEQTENPWGYSISDATIHPAQTPAMEPTDVPFSTTATNPQPELQPAEQATPSPSKAVSTENDNSFGEEGSPAFDCDAYPEANYGRMCASTDPCCESQRADTDFCWDRYEQIFPGDLIYSACQECCDNEKQVGPPNPDKPGLPKTIQCSEVVSPNRICKPNSCCQNPRSTSSYCRGVYEEYGADMEQICVSTTRCDTCFGTTNR